MDGFETEGAVLGLAAVRTVGPQPLEFAERRHLVIL